MQYLYVNKFLMSMCYQIKLSRKPQNSSKKKNRKKFSSYGLQKTVNVAISLIC